MIEMVYVDIQKRTCVIKYYNDNEPAHIDQIRIFSNEKDIFEISINIKYRYNRNQIIGDKFSSRHGQKGVLSQLYIGFFGFNYYGNEILYSGVSGLHLKAEIFIGVVYYQRLRHMVGDKYQARSTGSIEVLSRQPLKGRKKGGRINFII